MKKIKFYADIREMEKDRMKEISVMSPGERIKNTVELIRRIYPVRTKVSEKKKINIKG